jgi:hypothetical protein
VIQYYFFAERKGHNHAWESIKCSFSDAILVIQRLLIVALSVATFDFQRESQYSFNQPLK